MDNDDGDNKQLTVLTPKKKRSKRGELSKEEHTWRKQAFRDEWLQMSVFRGWLVKVESNKFKAKCKICNKELLSGKSQLLKHAGTDTHKSKMAALTNVKPIDTVTMFPTTGQNRKVKNSEMRWALFVAEHSTSFSSVDHLADLCRATFSGIYCSF